MRKKIGLAIISFCFLFFSAKAQFNWGVNGGANITNRTNFKDLGIDEKPLLTLQFSFFGIAPLGKLIAIQPSFGYHGKGNRFKNMLITDNLGNDLGEGDENVLFNYLQLNLPVQLRCNTDDNYKLYAGLGPYLAYLINGRYKVKNFHGSSNQSPRESGDIDLDGINRFDVGLNVGVSVIIQQHWAVSLTSDMGFINTIKQGSISSKNISAGVTVGYLIH